MRRRLLTLVLAGSLALSASAGLAVERSPGDPGPRPVPERQCRVLPVLDRNGDPIPLERLPACPWDRRGTPATPVSGRP